MSKVCSVGIEILRRLIGIAQLPLNLDLATKEKLMKRAAVWIMEEKLTFLKVVY